MRNHDEITETVKRYSATVARVCSLYFGTRPESDDAFQETFLKFAQATTVFADDEHRKAWLIRVASNTCKDMLKKAERKAVLVDRFDETASPQWQPGIEASDRAKELMAALQQLEEKHRIVLYLKYYEGYTASEMATALDIPENTVYTNLSRGREKLKEVLTRG